MASANDRDKDIDCGSKETRMASPIATTKNASQPIGCLELCTQDAQVQWLDDPINPHNWPAARKYTVTILLSALSFNTLMSSTMVAPALSRISKDLKISTDAETQLVLSIYVLAYAVGYFFWVPLSEVYGRKSIIQAANAWFCIWNLVCGFSENKATITVGRLFSGAGAASALALGTGTLGEIWRPAQRGRSLAMLSIVSLLGPCIGPIIGGAIAQRSLHAWRWAFWSTSIFNAVLQLVSFRFLHESHAPTILRRRGKAGDQGEAQGTPTPPPRTTFQILAVAFRRPLYLTLTQPASQGLIIYSVLSFGCLYVVLAVIPIAFTEVYQQSLTIASLNYTSYAIGTLLGSQICAPIIDYLYRRKTRQYAEQMASDIDIDEALRVKSLNQKAPPELRLYPFIPTVLLMSCGLLVFGWGIHSRKHWIMPDIGIAMFGAGNTAMTQCTNAYVIDIFSEVKPASGRETNSTRTSPITINWSASAMASIWAAKSLGGFAFPLFAVDLIRNLGWGWTGTLLAMLNLTVGLPIAILLLAHGPKLRDLGRKRIETRMETNSSSV
ncbi:hypothetical protein PMZ80_007507 [Knufia obscura]|uniref:Major facilitator superfamily (MFS) profile domain-containing protein n=1 Tax=Knufia obscura TaxID=1635080 RepID=A0ABR0RIZ4_9EURO|nr:hypothetical protein PMZ80_007507 [Knufia obscura]